MDLRLTLPECVLPVKLYYLNKINASATLREFRIGHKLQKGPLSLHGLKKMIVIFKDTESLAIQEEGVRPVLEEVITKVAVAIVEGSQGTTAGSSSAQGEAQPLDMNCSTAWRWKVLQCVICFYPYKISHFHEL